MEIGKKHPKAVRNNLSTQCTNIIAGMIYRSRESILSQMIQSLESFTEVSTLACKHGEDASEKMIGEKNVVN